MQYNNYSMSHQARNAGTKYQRDISSKYYGYVWNELEQPLLKEALARSAFSGRVLDVACGTGRVTSFLALHFNEVVGMDISASMLDEARKNYPTLTFAKAGIEKEHGFRIKYSLITAFRFFQNAEPGLRLQALAWIAAKLEPGGMGVINLHANPSSPYGLYQFLRRLLGLRAHGSTRLRDIYGSLPPTVIVDSVQAYGFWPRFMYFGSWCNGLARTAELAGNHLLPVSWRLKLAQHLLISVRRK